MKKTPPPLPERRYFDVKATAVYLGCTPGAVYATAQRRLIPHRKQGRKLLFDKIELDAYVKALEGVDADEANARLLHSGTMRGL